MILWVKSSDGQDWVFSDYDIKSVVMRLIVPLDYVYTLYRVALANGTLVMISRFSLAHGECEQQALLQHPCGTTGTCMNTNNVFAYNYIRCIVPAEGSV